MTVFTTYSQKSSTCGPDSQSHENEVNESVSSGAVKNKMNKPRISRMKDIRGFSLLEILMVGGMIAVVGAFSMMIIGPALEARDVDIAVRTVSNEMHRARQYAVDARRRTRVTFTNPATITVDQQAPVSQGGAWTQVSTTDLPGLMEFEVDAALSAVDGPEGHGVSAAIDFSGASQIWFMPDGSAVDTNGALSNGVVYVAEPSKVETSRAVTLFGSTGRIRRWVFDVDENKFQDSTWE
jgi:Tfp pilus assembly protein FimT